MSTTRNARAGLALLAAAVAVLSFAYALSSSPGVDTMDGFLMAGLCALVSLVFFKTSRTA